MRIGGRHDGGVRGAGDKPRAGTDPAATTDAASVVENDGAVSVRAAADATAVISGRTSERPI